MQRLPEPLFTPGPWLKDTEGYIYEDDATGRTICVIKHIDDMPRTEEQDMANAALIHAAPNMFEVLNELEGFRIGDTINIPSWLIPRMREALEKALDLRV